MAALFKGGLYVSRTFNRLTIDGDDDVAFAQARHPGGTSLFDVKDFDALHLPRQGMRRFYSTQFCAGQAFVQVSRIDLGLLGRGNQDMHLTLLALMEDPQRHVTAHPQQADGIAQLPCG